MHDTGDFVLQWQHVCIHLDTSIILISSPCHHRGLASASHCRLSPFDHRLFPNRTGLGDILANGSGLHGLSPPALLLLMASSHFDPRHYMAFGHSSTFGFWPLLAGWLPWREPVNITHSVSDQHGADLLLRKSSPRLLLFWIAWICQPFRTNMQFWMHSERCVGQVFNATTWNIWDDMYNVTDSGSFLEAFLTIRSCTGPFALGTCCHFQVGDHQLCLRKELLGATCAGRSFRNLVAAGWCRHGRPKGCWHVWCISNISRLAYSRLHWHTYMKIWCQWEASEWAKAQFQCLGF